ncbi:MAG: threonine--tRNA ligase, partial [Proteobacteria bacterium]|nr:threonine--tRNA ligase [Pseudomonadota bacterium]
ITLQIDFALPERFGMTYIDPDGNQKTPMVIHRSSIGCYERTMALLIERYAGRFPFWLAPEQIRILTLNNAMDDYAGDIEVRLLSARLRVSLDQRNESLNRKIREAQLEKIPAVLILGNREMEHETVSVRTLNGKTSTGITIDSFVKICGDLDANRSSESVFG